MKLALKNPKLVAGITGAVLVVATMLVSDLRPLVAEVCASFPVEAEADETDPDIKVIE